MFYGIKICRKIQYKFFVFYVNLLEKVNKYSMNSK